jgi:hypothetical protein
MNRIDLMRTFTRVVERGNFSSVAREQGLGQPANQWRVSYGDAIIAALRDE